ncbi:hypothetical protein BB561_006145 [Smittium simulii]|uniref:Uncharacterized protein n=1 Tax=Smittium simulii TaxID=133385 RepID=A0A2T9Y697_9FUNG|nr:hypothetical protein BB561_006145 [Smittium simulii]
MDQETINQIKELTDKVNQLLQERDPQEEPEDPYVTARIPVTDLAIYPELLEALPSIEEERKSAIYSCPKTSSMNYNPPPLKDSASSAVKKTDSALYGIQLALAQATRPIDFYVHRRIQDNPTLDRADDPEIMFASTMRALLSDVAASVTQLRLDNLHKGMDLPCKPQQLTPSEIKPLMDQETLDTLVANKKPAPKRPRIQPFCKRQQNSQPRDAISSNTVTAHITNAAVTSETRPGTQNQDRQSNFRGRGRGRGCTEQKKVDQGSQPSFNGRSGISTGQTCNRGNTTSAAGVLQSAFYNSKKDWRPPPSSRFEKAQSARGGAKLQDGDFILCLPDDPPKRLFYIFGSSGCAHAHSNIQKVQKIPSVSMERPDFSIPSSSFWIVPQPTYLYQGTPPSSRMGQVNRDTDFSVPRRPTNYGRNQDTVYNQHTFSLFQAFGAWLQNQRGEIVNIPISIDYPLGNDNIAVPSKFCWKGSGHVSGSSSRTTYATPSTRAKELLLKEIEIMDVDGGSDKASNSESTLLEESAKDVERALVSARDSRSGSLHRCQRQSLGNRTLDSTIRSLTQGNIRPLSVGLLRQHNHASLCKKFWRHDVSQTTGIIGDNLETLFKNKHQTPGNIRADNIERCGRSKQTDCSNRMVFILGDVQEAESST